MRAGKRRISGAKFGLAALAAILFVICLGPAVYGGFNLSKAIQGGDPTGRRQQKPGDAQAGAQQPPSLLDLMIGRNLEQAGKYCSRDRQNDAEKWIASYWCGVKITDVVSALSAFASMVVGACLLIVGFLQWRVVARQAAIGADQAKIMQVQAALADSANALNTAVHRPFLHSHEITWTAEAEQPGPAEAWVLRYNVENAGSTPTKDALMYTCGRYFKDDMPRDFDFTDTSHGYWQDIFLGPKATVPGLGWRFKLEELERSRHGEGACYLWSIIEYSDTFTGKRHVTRRCSRVMATGHDIRFLDSFGPASATHDKHNCADEACEAQYGRVPSIEERRSSVERWAVRLPQGRAEPTT